MTDRHLVEEAQRRFNERVARQLRTMAPGNPDGRIAGAAPIPPPPPRPEVYGGAGGGAIVLDFPGYLYVGTTIKVTAPETRSLSVMTADLTVSGSSTTTVSIEKNGVSVATLSLVAGDIYESTAVAIDVAAGSDTLLARVTAAGTGAQTLVVQLL